MPALFYFCVLLKFLMQSWLRSQAYVDIAFKGAA